MHILLHIDADYQRQDRITFSQAQPRLEIDCWIISTSWMRIDRIVVVVWITSRGRNIQRGHHIPLCPEKDSPPEGIIVFASRDASFRA